MAPSRATPVPGRERPPYGTISAMTISFEFLMHVAADLQWLNRTIAVASAQRKARQVLLFVHQLL